MRWVNGVCKRINPKNPQRDYLLRPTCSYGVRSPRRRIPRWRRRGDRWEGRAIIRDRRRQPHPRSYCLTFSSWSSRNSVPGGKVRKVIRKTKLFGFWNAIIGGPVTILSEPRFLNFGFTLFCSNPTPRLYKRWFGGEAPGNLWDFCSLKR